MTTGILTLLLTLGVGGAPPDVYTMRNTNLEIPIRVNDAKRSDIKELELHVSTDQGRTWTLSGRARPDQQAFAFHAPGDGLYWFSVCAIDKAGHRDPEDIATSKPALKVLIDTAHPALQVVAVDRVGEEVQVAWECSDSQADPTSLRLEYRPAGAEPTAVWSPVPVPSQLIGTCRFRPIHGGAITMRMQIVDGAGSPATVVKDVPAAAVAAPPPAAIAAVPPPAPVTVPTPTPVVANSMAPPPVAPFSPLPTTVNPQPAPQMEPPTPMPAAAPMMATPPVVDAPVGPAPLAPLHSATEPIARSSAPAPPASEFAAPSHGSLGDVLHVRDRTVAVDFDVDRRGPSGVKKIEVYCTQDDGQSWVKYSESLNANPPLQLDLPKADGLYGFCMVLYSGVGQSQGPPRSREDLQFRVLVDRSPPQVTLYEPKLDDSQPNALLIRYKATDTNLVKSSVTLAWRSGPEKPWQTLTAGPPHEYSGVEECSWSLPPDVPNSVYLRITARDLAGNVGEFVTRDPVTVDLNKPIARFKGITSVSYRRPQ